MNKDKNALPFSKINYGLMITGIVLIGLGYLAMALDKEPHGFGILGLTIGPITILMGYLIEFIAILYIPKKQQSPNR